MTAPPPKIPDPPPKKRNNKMPLNHCRVWGIDRGYIKVGICQQCEFFIPCGGSGIRLVER